MQTNNINKKYNGIVVEAKHLSHFPTLPATMGMTKALRAFA
jgi:hypothetical protein